eukprot:1346182-Pleurochrysis_carterae.AAC.1
MFKRYQAFGGIASKQANDASHSLTPGHSSYLPEITNHYGYKTTFGHMRLQERATGSYESRIP